MATIGWGCDVSAIFFFRLHCLHFKETGKWLLKHCNQMAIIARWFADQGKKVFKKGFPETVTLWCMVFMLDLDIYFTAWLVSCFILYKRTLEQVLYDFSMMPFVTTEASMWSQQTAVWFLFICLHETCVKERCHVPYLL